MSEKRPSFVVAADALGDWRDDVLSGQAPTLYAIGKGPLENIEVGPGRILLFGGAPGSGKTAFTMQIIVDMLRLNPGVKACVLNVEMPPQTLLDRQLSRLSGIDLNTIRHRRLGRDHAERIELALSVLENVADRLVFVRPPFTLDGAAAVVDSFGADVILLDYVQRIPPPGEHENRRGSVDATMSFLREFADEGYALLVVAAVSRTKDSKGRSSYDADGLSLASFRESSELEFGCDDGFILAPDPEAIDLVVLRHLKARHTEPRDITFRFERKCQRFIPAGGESTGSSSPDRRKTQDVLTALWNRTAPAGAEEDNA